MSSPQDSETKRAALEKAREGARLLSAGDYQGAIAAFTEAMRLDPRLDDAYVLRSEAYRRSEKRGPLGFMRDILDYEWRFVRWTFAHGDDYWDPHMKGKVPEPPRSRQRDQRERVEDSLAALGPTAMEIAESGCSILRNIWIDARVLPRAEAPDDEQAMGWIETSEGPIRWLQFKTVGWPPVLS